MRQLTYATVVGIIFTVSQAGATDTLTARTLQEMKRRDEPIIRTGLSLNGKMREWSPLGDRKDIGGLARHLHFRSTCKRLTAVYEQTVEVFEEIPQRTEPTDPEAADRYFIYNEDGVQFFIFVARRRALYQRGVLNAVLRTTKSLYVEPDGKFGLGEAEGYALELYPLDDLMRTMTRAQQVLLCSGRGYTFVIDHSSATSRKRADGLIEIRAKGREAPELPLYTFFADEPALGRNTVWLLVVDPKADYLVREATFFFLEREEPLIQIKLEREEPFIQIKTSGWLSLKGGATIAKYGEYRLKPAVPYGELKVEFTKGEWRFSQAFYEEVRHSMLNPPDETTVWDYRFGEPPFTFTYREAAAGKAPDTNHSTNR